MTLRKTLPAGLLVLLIGCAGADKEGPDDTAVSDDTGGASPTWVDEPVFCASPSVTLSTYGAGYLATTEHYQLQIYGFDETETRNLAALAETAWEGFASFFGVEVEGPLEAIIAADEPGFEAVLAADGITEPEGAGGWYEPGNGRAYLYRQPTAYYSRVLLLHELTHQYQDHSSYTSGLPFWYVEGLAESLGRHHWDGDCLQLRVCPLLSWEDAASDASAELDAGASLSDLLSGASGSRPLAQELVRLLSGDPDYADGFATWRQDVADGVEPTDLDILATAIAPTDEIEDRLIDFVPEDQEPMTPIYLDWVPQANDGAWGFADYSAAARYKAPTDSFSMHIDLPTGGENVGSVYGYDPATGDIELAFVSADGTVSRFAVISGGVTWDLLGSVSLGADVDWSQVAGEDVTTVTISGASVALPRALPSAGGLSLYAADAQFSEIVWE